MNRPTLVGPKGWAMVFGLKSRSARDDQTQSDADRTPYRLASYGHDYEGRKFKSSGVVYSFWSAAKYTLVLSIVLWWLPLFGQMIAGYVGGRRAGGPWKGVAAAIIPVACLYVVLTGFDSGFFPSHILGVAVAPAAVSASLGQSIPFISPYIQFSSEYVGSFVAALAGSSPYGINTYVVTVAFAYVGGILAEQSRREIEFTSGSTMSNTTVLVHDSSKDRSHPYPEPTHPGLAHAISSHLPWSRDHHAAHQGSHQHVFALPPVRAAGAGGWQYANQMAFQNEDGRSRDQMMPPSSRATGAAHSGSRSHHKGGAKGSSMRSNQGQRANRRVKQHYSSASRFAPASGDAIGTRSTRSRRNTRARRPSTRSRAPPASFAPSDPKAARKARKAIDKDWRRSRSKFVVPSRSQGDFVDDVDFVDAPAPHDRDRSRDPRTTQKRRWDTI
jgi:hypothetical protein